MWGFETRTEADHQGLRVLSLLTNLQQLLRKKD